MAAPSPSQIRVSLSHSSPTLDDGCDCRFPTMNVRTAVGAFLLQVVVQVRGGYGCALVAAARWLMVVQLGAAFVTISLMTVVRRWWC